MSETEDKLAIFCKHCKRRIHPDDYSGSGFRHEEDWSIRQCSGTLAEPELTEQRGVTLVRSRLTQMASCAIFNEYATSN
jgi:hypothetical protein